MYVQIKYAKAERPLHTTRGVFVDLQGLKGGEFGGSAVVDARYDVMYAIILGGHNMRSHRHEQKPQPRGNTSRILGNTWVTAKFLLFPPESSNSDSISISNYAVRYSRLFCMKVTTLWLVDVVPIWATNSKPSKFLILFAFIALYHHYASLLIACIFYPTNHRMY